MKIKITDLDNVIEVQEILRDMNIKQPTYGYSDVFTIPNDMKDEVFDLFKRRNIKWTKSSKNESKLSKWINKIINEEVRKVRLKEDKYSAEIAQRTNTRKDAVDQWLKMNEVDGLTILQGIGNKKIDFKDFVQALLSDEATLEFLRKYNSDGRWSSVWNSTNKGK